MLLAEHSPIRLVEYDVTFEDIKQWVTTHQLGALIQKYILNNRVNNKITIIGS